MKALSILGALLLCACSTLPSPAERQQLADAMAAQHGWQAMPLSVQPLALVAYVPIKPGRNSSLTVYIEGDGFAWRTGSQPSTDPTPRDPLALRLALAQPDGNAAYLARPCQFVDAEKTGCAARYWTSHRFAPEVIAASSQAIDELKARSGARQLVLVGYSGGAAVAALVAAQRSDVALLVTVAGNLDHRAWTAHHQLQPLTGSLNPADAVAGLRSVKQWHYVGGQDRIIPPALVTGFAALFADTNSVHVRVEPAFDHHCCWSENWPRLWSGIGKIP